MKTETSPQELLTRRQFFLQAAAVGGALASPVNMFAQAEAVASGDAVETTELLHGWSLKSVEPQAGLTAEFLSHAGRAAAADGWLPVAAMPAMVPDVLLAHGKVINKRKNSRPSLIRLGELKCALAMPRNVRTSTSSF